MLFLGKMVNILIRLELLSLSMADSPSPTDAAGWYQMAVDAREAVE